MTGRYVRLHFELYQGYGTVCDVLRRKGDYFAEDVLSLDELKNRGMESQIHINVRYYP